MSATFFSSIANIFVIKPSILYIPSSFRVGPYKKPFLKQPVLPEKPVEKVVFKLPAGF
jgi:hypothetical protein